LWCSRMSSNPLSVGCLQDKTGGPSDSHTSYARTPRSKMAGNPVNGSNGGAGIHNRSAEACLSAPVGYNSITSATTTSLPSVTVMSPLLTLFFSSSLNIVRKPGRIQLPVWSENVVEVKIGQFRVLNFRWVSEGRKFTSS
jgi:hypothetical protein